MHLTALVLDMDGVLWRGETAMPGLADFFATLRRRQLNFMLATNNATKIATQYTEKLARFGVAVPPEQILTSAEATAGFLRQQYPAGARIFVVGEQGLHLALAAQGFELLPNNGRLDPTARADLVVVGFNRHATYTDMATAAYLIRQGARFIGTNPDKTFPSEIGPLPGAGSLLAFVETGSGQAPTIVGKPGRVLFDEAVRRLGTRPEQTAMVGDRLETDIAGGQNAGLRTILLLSGVTGREELARSPIHPDLVLADITALAAYLENDQTTS
ncbi:MAG: HAD-IIA family hydrolase [Anaerolineales bacterium]|nr:HAD-IIA family hydrolase [Anaerolineales bacterium]